MFNRSSHTTPAIATNPRTGFTLIELLVVIAIIAILIGIAFPVVSKVRGSAQKVTCGSSLRQLGLVMEMYTQEHKFIYPAARYMPEPFASTSPNPPITEVLRPYIDTGSEAQRVYRCPDDDQVFDRAGISYDYFTMLSGRKLEDMLQGRMRRLDIDATQIVVMRDFDNGEFLLNDGSTLNVPMRHIGRNILFADGHVGKLEF